MAIIDLDTFEKLQTKLTANKISVVLIYSPTCKLCKQIDSLLNRIHTEYADTVSFFKINGKYSDDSEEVLNVHLYPTTRVYLYKEEEARIEGLLSESNIRAILDAVKNTGKVS